MPPIQVNTDKLHAMLKDWRAQAAGRALVIKKLRGEIEEAKKKPDGGKLPAADVANYLALVSEFYLIEGRVKMLEELLVDLIGSSEPAGPAPATGAGASWMLPKP